MGTVNRIESHCGFPPFQLGNTSLRRDSPWRRQAASCCTASGRAGPSRESLGCRCGRARPGGRRWSLPCCGFRGVAVLAPPPQRPAARLGSSHRSSSLGPVGGYWTADWTSEWRLDLREFASQQRGLSNREPKALQRLSFSLPHTQSGRNSECAALLAELQRVCQWKMGQCAQPSKTFCTTNFSGRLLTTQKILPRQEKQSSDSLMF